MRDQERKSEEEIWRNITIEEERNIEEEKELERKRVEERESKKKKSRREKTWGRLGNRKKLKPYRFSMICNKTEKSIYRN